MEVRYVTVDVFTDVPFGGNPLAVVPEAEGLADGQMQAIAAEFNYPETSFVLAPESPDHTARVRIFTPKAEVPFAGHPNVGTAFVLARLGAAFGRPVQDAVIFEEGAGLVPVAIEREGRTPVGARLTAPQPLRLGDALDPAAVADCLGLTAPDIVTSAPPRIVSVGLAVALVEVPDLATLAHAAIRADAMAALLPPERAIGFHLYVVGPRGATQACDLRARFFAPLMGVPEDPATGSANAALAAFLAHIDPRPQGDYRFSIRQRVEMGRPSVLDAGAVKRGGGVASVTIGGRCVAMMEGRLTL